MSERVLLVMDVQQQIVGRFGDDREYLSRLQQAIAAARAAEIAVIYVKVEFRSGHPEISPRNRSFAALAQSGGLTVDDPGTQVHPAVAPRAGDVVVTKKRVSAFAGSDLDVVLRGLGAHRLILAGIATSGVVLSTLRQAADLDFDLTVLSDGCLDADDEVHRVLTEKVFPRQATVLTVADWMSSLK